MKRALVVMVAVCAAALLIVALAGCDSGGTSQVKQTLKDAGAEFSKGQTIDGELSKMEQAFRDSLLKGEQVTDQQINQLKSAEAQAETAMGRARKLYDEAAAMKGAGDYAAYGRMMASASQTSISYSRKKLEYLQVFLDAAKNPSGTDTNTLEQQITSLEKDITSLRDQIKASAQDAADFAHEKKLF